MVNKYVLIIMLSTFIYRSCINDLIYRNKNLLLFQLSKYSGSILILLPEFFVNTMLLLILCDYAEIAQKMLLLCSSLMAAFVCINTSWMFFCLINGADYEQACEEDNYDIHCDEEGGVDYESK